ncbi:MAG: P-loop NTPase fold protein [Methylococcales bacterium]|nr:P-loop NTPase fold protein [Methylococcales bacterium]MDP3839425.1 P-loop NTPase fold protein [Methylococcales bacterium]
MTTPNKHIEEFLDYYYNFEKPPEYAVLLKGNWGVGKTWFITKTLETFKQDGGKYLYVSLYGINSYEEIEGEFFKQLHPLLSSKSMTLAGKIAKGLLKTTIHIDIDQDKRPEGNVSSQIPDINLPEYLTKTEGFVLVFDDLERCSININNILGYINHFVEHQGYKVIIIANEDEILAKEKDVKNDDSITYKRIKEKLVGKTFEIEADLNSALQFFINEIPCDKVQRLCNANIQLINELYENSDYKNLRHLKQALWDFERFYRHLPEAAKSKEELVIHLLKLYLCYSFEIKSGNILPCDIKSLSMSYAVILATGKQSKEKSIYEKISKKYTNISFFESLLESSIWLDIFDKGFINSSAIEESLLKSRYFQDKNTPTWIKLWHFTDLTDDEFTEYLQIVEDEFYTMKYDELGVVMHLVGFFLNLSEINLYKKEKNETLIFSKKYIDSLKDKGFLTRKECNIFNESWGGLGFFGKELDEFKEFCNYIKEKTDVAIDESYPDAGQELLKLMTEDIEKFYRRINYCNHEDNIYCDIPILLHISPNEFVSTLMNISPKDKRTAVYALVGRYNYNISALKQELEWLKKVRDLLIQEQQSREGKLSAYQIRNFIEYYLNKAIESLSS